jgi:dienelactone hydrolase
LKRRVLGGLLLAGIGCGFAWLFVPRKAADPERFLQHHIRIAKVAALDSLASDGRRYRDLELETETGLRIHGRLSFPPGEGPFPAVILQGGLNTGSKVLFFLIEPGPVVWASLDYPYRLPHRAGFFTVLRAMPHLRQRTEETVGALLVLLDYLESLREVDPSRTAVLGGSLGSPFAALAGAIEPRFEGVGLLYGGADLARIAEARLPYHSALARAGTRRLLRPWLDPVDPSKFVPRISPRPILLVNGRADSEIPRSCVLALHAAARNPKTIVWVDTPHKVQGNAALMDSVAQAVWMWLEEQGWLRQ